MILTSSSVNTVRFTSQIASELETCQRVNTFYDAGWFIVYGWRDEKLVVQSHADSADEYMRIRFGGTPYSFNGQYQAAFTTMSKVLTVMNDIKTFLSEANEFLSVRNLGKKADKLGNAIVDHFFRPKSVVQNIQMTKELLADISEFFMNRNCGDKGDALRIKATHFIQDLDRAMDDAQSVVEENRFQ